MDPLNVLFVQDRPEILGGALLYMQALRRHLEARGHRCRVVGFSGSGGQGAGDALRLPGRQRGAWAQRAVAKLGWDPALYRQLRRCFLRFRPDLVHLHNWLSGGNAVLLACAGLPTVWTVHDVGVLCPLGGRAVDAKGETCAAHFGRDCLRKGCYTPRVFLEEALLRESVKRWALRTCVDRVIVHSRFLGERLEAYGLDSLRLPRPVDVQAFPFVPAPPSSRTVLFVGYLDDSKGLDVLLEAFPSVREAVPGATLEIVGDGPRREVYLRASRRLAPAVRFHGQVHHGAMTGYYQRSAVVAIPSRVPETGPFVALEAMSTGRPVVGSRLGGLPEIVEEGRSGYLVPPGDREGLARRIVHLLGDPGRASRMGLQGRRRVEAMSREDPFPEIERLYHQVVDDRRKRRCRPFRPRT